MIRIQARGRRANLGRMLVGAVIVILASWLVDVSLAKAHVDGASALGLAAGLLHPVSGLDHVLAMVAVGLWGAQLGQPSIWVLPVVFPLVMALGGFLALVGISIPGVEMGIAFSALLLGLAVAVEARLSIFVAAVLVGAFAIFHGHAHGVELPAGENGLVYSIGFVVATGCLHATGIVLGTVHRWSWGAWAIRAAGAVVACAGLVFIWRAAA